MKTRKRKKDRKKAAAAPGKDDVHVTLRRLPDHNDMSGHDHCLASHGVSDAEAVRDSDLPPAVGGVEL